VAARMDDMDALVASDTRFHELLVDVSGRGRLKDLWSILNSQMGALMRSEIERQGIGLTDAVERHRDLFDAVSSGDLARLRVALREHYLAGFPDRGQGAARAAGAAAADGIRQSAASPAG
jgi:GntR family transcriptional regulator, rspAB operon transcriptional repressor